MKLIPALKLALKLAKGKSSLPVLNHVFVEPGQVTVTNLSHWAIIKADYQGPAALLPVQALRDGLKKAKTFTVSQVEGEHRFKLDNGTVTTVVQGGTPEDYPEQPTGLSWTPVPGCFSASRLARAHARLSPFASTDVTREVLNWYLLETHPEAATAEGPLQGAARLIACNGHAVTTAMTRNLGSREGEPTETLVHPFMVEQALQAQGDGVLTIAVGKGKGLTYTRIQNDQVTLLSNVPDSASKYPNWRQVVHQGGLAAFAVSSSHLAAVLGSMPNYVKGVELSSDGLKTGIGWADEATDGKVTLRATAENRTPAVLKGTVPHPLLSIVINGPYLRSVAARSPGRLTFVLGPGCKKPSSISCIAEQGILAVDSDQTEDEVTCIMQMRSDRVLAPHDWIQLARPYLEARGLEGGVLKPEETAEAA